MVDNVFYQHGDEPDAANFAQAYGLATLANYIVDGFEFTIDLSIPSLDVNSGQAVIQRGSMMTASPNIDPPETRKRVAHPISVDARTGISLQDNDLNHVYLDANIGSSDSPKIETNTTGIEPTSESIKIGEVDTTEDVPEQAISEQWNLVIPDGTFTYPNEGAADEGAEKLPAGTIVFERDNKTRYQVQ